MHILKTITYCSFFFLSFMGKANSDEEEKLIRETLMDYIEGTANGEPERLRRAFHPDFNLYSTTENDELRIWEGEDYINRIQPGKKANRIGRIVSVDREGTTATAKVEIVVPGWRVFTDYFLLVKYAEQWKIVHKSYSFRPFTNQDVANLANSHLDTIFREVDRSDHPGVATAAILNGEVVYQGAFGSENLDYKIPATIDTKFQLAGMSKHFTAFAVLLLEEQGELSLTDDIRDYLPWLPAYEETITIDHLLSMTSGFSDFWDLKTMAGIHSNDVFSQEHALSFISKIKPAFNPGDDHIYSNTDQVLLAEIVSSVAKKPFADFMEELFSSLGMANTLVVDDFESNVSNVATSYTSDQDGGFNKNAINYGIYGPTNVYSSISDLIKWEMNLLEPTLGTSDLVEKLYSTCTLNDGSTIDSWSGRQSYAQQFYHWGHGVDEVYQIASLGGYSCSIFKFPDQDFTVMIMSSGMPYSGYLGMGLAAHFIGDEFNDPEEIDFTSLKTVKVKEKKLKSYEGYYWSDKSHFSRNIAFQNDTLRYMRSDGRSSALLPLAENRFQMVVGGGEVVILNFDEDQLHFTSGDVNIIFRKVDEASYSSNQLNPFTGTFYCRELNTVYQLEVEEGKLVAKHPRLDDIGFHPAMENTFESEVGLFGSIQFNEDRTKFLLESEDVKGVWFERI